MRRLKLYLDTSTICHLFAEDTPDKMEDTHRLWDDLVSGKYKVYISPVVTDELEKCAEPRRSQMLERIQQINLQVLAQIPDYAFRRGGRIMKTSTAMDEIRRIRDENSLRRLSQTPEERKRELDESVKWFVTAIGKPVTIVTKDKS